MFARTLPHLDLPALTHLLVSLPERLLARVQAATELARQRRALAALDDRALDDIGVSRPQAVAEAARPFWDAPRNWCH